MLDLNSLTLGEIAKIESLTGLPIASTIGDGVPQGKSLAAWALIHARRDGRPSFSWPDALALTMDEAFQILGIDLDNDEDADDDREDADVVDPADVPDVEEDVAEEEDLTAADKATPAGNRKTRAKN